MWNCIRLCQTSFPLSNQRASKPESSRKHVASAYCGASLCGRAFGCVVFALVVWPLVALLWLHPLPGAAGCAGMFPYEDEATSRCKPCTVHGRSILSSRGVEAAANKPQRIWHKLRRHVEAAGQQDRRRIASGCGDFWRLPFLRLELLIPPNQPEHGRDELLRFG